MSTRGKRAFTIVELLVVVSIIALLVGILLPAIGQAREQAKLTQSQSNLRNISSANFTYASEWNDRQLTYTDDNFSSYGANQSECITNYSAAYGISPTADFPFRFSPILGVAPPNWIVYWWGGGSLVVPMSFETEGTAVQGYGWFRAVNGRQIGQYVTGRFYDRVYFAPKDVAVVAAVEACFDAPGEYCSSTTPNGSTPGAPPSALPCSYAYSAASLMSPNVFKIPDSEGDWVNPYDMPAGFRCPSTSQALYPELKGHLFEHHWLQGAGYRDCNPAFTGGRYNGCEPFYFNHGFSSSPVTAWYDGHIESFGQLQAISANDRQMQQSGNAVGLQHTLTDLPDYFSGAGFDWTETSHYILTTEGIRGRDKLGD